VASGRLSGDDEREAIFAAALRVMRENGYAQAQLSDILAEAGLSTRAFYRHFDSKDDLLLALFRDNAEVTADRLRERVRAGDSSTDQLGAWIDEILSLGYDRRRARRAGLFSSEAARRTVGYAEESTRAAVALTASLREVLEAGAASGEFPRCDPAHDAATMYAVVWQLVGDAMRGAPAMTEAEARLHARRFCFAAIGIDAMVTTPAGQPRLV
jgi:AcrR family transcriptional regulator